MDPRFNLDPEIARMCDDAQTWLMVAACAAAALGRTLAEGIAATLPRLHTGYMPRAQRSAVAHGLYSMGVRKAPARETAADKARAEAQMWGLAS